MDIKLPKEGVDLQATLEAIARTLIQQALDKCEGNKTKAADLLGIGRTTLIEKMRSLDMQLGTSHKARKAS